MKEKIQPINKDGQQAGSQIGFDYIPGLASETIKQLKDFVNSGMKNASAYPLLNITINQYNDNGSGTQNINYIDADSMFQGTIDRLEGKNTEAAQYAAKVESGEV